MGLIGSDGFVAWTYAYIYLKIRNACKNNIYVKLFVHSIGLAAMILGLFLLVSTIPSVTSILGVIIALFGLVAFFTPLGLD